MATRTLKSKKEKLPVTESQVDFTIHRPMIAKTSLLGAALSRTGRRLSREKTPQQCASLNDATVTCCLLTPRLPIPASHLLRNFTFRAKPEESPLVRGRLSDNILAIAELK
jgi:hypothetical protein